MNKFIVFTFTFMTGCGLDPLSLAQKAAATTDSHDAKSCEQAYNEVAYLENHSGAAVNFTMEYPDYSSSSSQFGTINVQIPAGGTWSQVLVSFHSTLYGDFDGNGHQADASCTATPQQKLVDLSTLDGTSTVRRCKVKDGVAYLLSPASPCPDYTSE